jgi:hypothetical protein
LLGQLDGIKRQIEELTELRQQLEVLTDLARLGVAHAHNLFDGHHALLQRGVLTRVELGDRSGAARDRLGPASKQRMVHTPSVRRVCTDAVESARARCMRAVEFDVLLVKAWATLVRGEG